MNQFSIKNTLNGVFFHSYTREQKFDSVESQTYGDQSVRKTKGAGWSATYRTTKEYYIQGVSTRKNVEVVRITDILSRRTQIHV